MRKVSWVIGLASLGLVLSECGEGGTLPDPEGAKDSPECEVNADADIAGSPTWKNAHDQGSITIGVDHDQPGDRESHCER